MSRVPETWIECTLGEVVDYGATTKVEPEEIPANAWILELEDIEKDTSQIIRRLTFKERDPRSTKNQFEKGDVLYGKLRPYLNKVVIADSDGFCTTEIIPLKADDKALDSRFLFYWLKHPRFLDYVTSVSHGLNMPRLGTDAGKAAPFILAPHPEQKRIADKLDAVLGRMDACRARLTRVPDLLNRFRQSVLAAATSGRLTEDCRTRDSASRNVGPRVPKSTNEAGEWHFEELPATWRWLDFSAIFEDLTDSKRKLPQNEYAPSGKYPVVDQGEKQIGGYTSRGDLVSEAAPPIVIFGDHTRCVKWVDIPFVQGADGVKVLVPNPQNVAARYAYFALLATRLSRPATDRAEQTKRAARYTPPAAQRHITRVRARPGE